MELLTAVLASLIAIAVLYAVAGRIGLPYPTLFVLGGLALAFVPGLPRIGLDPELVLLVFLPPLLFIAALETPIRELRANIVPIGRLAFGLVIVTIGTVAVAAQLLVPSLGWAAAVTLGSIVAPTDALAATTVIRRLQAPRIVQTLLEGEALFNDATALISYRVAVGAAVGGGFVLISAAESFLFALVVGAAIGVVVGWLGAELIRRLDEPTVEVIVGFVLPFAAYLPADVFGASGVIAAVTCGLIVGSRVGRILTARSRILWLGSWKMIAFVLNGFVFLLIGLELPTIVAALEGRATLPIAIAVGVVCLVVVLTRFAWTIVTSLLPNSPRQQVARRDPVLARRFTFIVGWAGLRGAVSLAAALALPQDFPERDLILLVTFAVIMVTLVGQGASLPFLVNRAGLGRANLDTDEGTLARQVAYEVGVGEIARQRPLWPTHQPMFDRLESGLRDRSEHLATEDANETAERRQERLEHEQIQLAVIGAQRNAVIDLRDNGLINDETLRDVERELDLEELRMEG